MGFIQTAEAGINRALSSAVGGSTATTEASRQRDQNLVNIGRVAAMNGAGTPIPIQPSTTTPISVRPSNNNADYLSRAGGGSGSSGVLLPPVGIRGAGPQGRVTLLGGNPA